MPNDLDHVRSLAKQDSLAVVTTTRSDGTIHASVVRAGVLDFPEARDTRVGFVAAGSVRKLRYLRESGRAAVVFRHGWDWVAVEGPVQLVGPEDPLNDFGASQLARLLRQRLRRRGRHPPRLGRVRPCHGGRGAYGGVRHARTDKRQQLTGLSSIQS